MCKEFTCGTYERQPTFCCSRCPWSIIWDPGVFSAYRIRGTRSPSIHRVTHTGGYCSCTTPREKHVCELSRVIKNLQLHHWYLLEQQRRCRPMSPNGLTARCITGRVIAEEFDKSAIYDCTSSLKWCGASGTPMSAVLCCFLNEFVELLLKLNYVAKLWERKLTILHSGFMLMCGSAMFIALLLNVSTFYCCIMCCCILTFFGGKS